jgi:uncharacterized protein
MTRRYPQIAFGTRVKDVQRENGSRVSGQRLETMEWNDEALGERERELIESLDHFYMATTTESGWPYVQFRGGPKGFLHVLEPRLLGFADFRGNMQYISTGNVRRDDRVALFLIDQAQRTRLKIFARAEVAPLNSERGPRLIDPAYEAVIERAYLFHVEAFDWNCPRHITPRFSADEMRAHGSRHENQQKPTEITGEPS